MTIAKNPRQNTRSVKSSTTSAAKKTGGIVAKSKSRSAIDTRVRTKKTIASPRKKNPTSAKRTHIEKDKQNTKLPPVHLPTNMSKRAVEKSAVLMQEFEHYFSDAMYRIAYVAGLCFILVGATYASIGLIENPIQQKATLTEAVDLSSEGLVAEPVNTIVEQIPPSEFEYLTDVPKNITEATEVYFEVSHADEIIPKLVVVGKIGFIDLPAEKISDLKYRVIIPVKSLATNYYELRVYVKPADGSDQYVERTNQFFVGSTDVEKWFNEQLLKEAVLDEEGNIAEGTSNNTGNVTDAADTDGQGDTPINGTGQTEVSKFEIKSRASVLVGIANVDVAVSEDATDITLYARRIDEQNSSLVDIAEKHFENSWIFTFDSTKLLNGEYEFFAQTKIGVGTRLSNSLKLSVSNVVTNKSGDDFQIELPNKLEEPEASDSSTEPYTPTVTFDERVSDETKALIADNREDFNELLTNYAAAKQAGDESLIRVAKEALDALQETILLDVHREDRVRDISDTISDELANRVLDLQNRIDTFDELRKQRSNGAITVDTDGDGVSNMDESKLYKTDPGLADTDDDGVADGIEIMRGYNPSDATPEAVIRFESPKETFGLTRHDALEIAEVIPLITNGITDEQTSVAAEIRGKGLPNSFVTLYVFSTPTVVTVKTDADGYFVYTFDKELEDGQHDVYVTLTDNVGAIIAQSNPFTFVKEAQAFTPVSAADEAALSPQPITEDPGKGYALAIGVGILGFGLILLMLGISLRKEENGEVIIIEKPLPPEKNVTSESL